MDAEALYVAGTSATDFSAYVVRKLSGGVWTQLGDAFTIGVYQADLSDDRAIELKEPRLQIVNSDLYLYGNFNYNSNTNIQFLARWNRSVHEWEQVGSVLNGPVWAITGLRGNLVVGGAFTSAGGDTNVNAIATLLGGAWTRLGSGIGGTNWYYDGSTNFPAAVFSLATCNSNLYVGGDFTSAGGDTNARSIAIWDGLTWKAIGKGLYSRPVFDIYQSSYAYPGKMNCTNPIVYSISPHGNVVYVAGAFSDSINADGDEIATASIAKATWDEAIQQWTWSDLNGGVYGSDPDFRADPWDAIWPGRINCTAILPGPTVGSYNLLVGGGFEGRFRYAGTSKLWLPAFACWRVGYPQPNIAPVVKFTSPMASAVITNPPSISLSAVATSSYTNIYSAHIFTNGVEVGYPAAYADPTNILAFTNVWSAPSPGVYQVQAVAYDDCNGNPNLLGASQPIVITIKGATSSFMAVNDQYSVVENTPSADLYVTTNDASSSPIRISSLLQPNAGLGTVTIGYDGSYIRYTPLPHVFGTDLVYYSITNSAGSNDSACVTINILAPPSVQLLYPPDDNQRYVVSASPITLNATAHAFSGGLSNVMLFTNGVACRPFMSSGGENYTTNWTSSVAGYYTFTAVATDSNGLSSVSLPTTVVFTNSTASLHLPAAEISNLMPTVVASYGITSTNPAVISSGIFSLLGTASDQDASDEVCFSVAVYRPSDWEPASSSLASVLDSITPFIALTPAPVNAQGFHKGSVTDGNLGTLDMTTIPNGTYDMVLRVRGGTDETNAIVRFVLNSQLKLGQFTFSEQDLMLPVNGIPLTVTRTYNSQNTSAGVFGQSWSYALNDMNVELNEQRRSVIAIGADGDASDLETSNPMSFSLRTGGGRDVTLTLPDNRRVTFYFTLVQSAYVDDSSAFYDAKWVTPQGVSATLTTLKPATRSATGDNTLVAIPGMKPSWCGAGGGLFVPMDAYDFASLVLSNWDGTQYVLQRDAEGENPPTYYYEDVDGLFGGTYRMYNIQPHPGNFRLASIIQRTGDTIKIQDNGIFHCTNNIANPDRGAWFDRDSSGRIIAIRDPNSGSNGLATVKYVYNRENGNMLQVLKLVDRITGDYVTNRYHYDSSDFPHYITSIENAAGTPVVRNFYDSGGRLTALQDANGNLTQYIHDVVHNQEMIVDALGRTMAESIVG